MDRDTARVDIKTPPPGPNARKWAEFHRRYAAHMGSYFLDQLRGLQKKYDFISDGRGIGLMDAMEIDTRERRDRILRRAMERGLLLLGSGYKVVRFLPPLDVRRREIDMALEILHGTFRNTKR